MKKFVLFFTVCTASLPLVSAHVYRSNKGVKKINPGTNITITPANGTGVVTINSNLLTSSPTVTTPMTFTSSVTFSSANVTIGIATLTITGKGVGVWISTPSSLLEVHNGSITVRGTNAGLAISTAMTVDFGGNIRAESLNIRSTITIPASGVTPGSYSNATVVVSANGLVTSASAGQAAATVITTFTAILGAGGDVALSTVGFIPIPGAFTTIGHSTWNVIQIQAFNLTVSTFGSNFYSIALATGGAVPSTFTYITTRLEVSTNNMFSVWTSTAFTVPFNSSLSLHVMESSTTAGASSAGEYGMKIQYWRQPE